MMEFIQMWWPVLVIPTIVAVATTIAKITPNKTDDKIILAIMKIVDTFAIHAEKTVKK